MALPTWAKDIVLILISSVTGGFMGYYFQIRQARSVELKSRLRLYGRIRKLTWEMMTEFICDDHSNKNRLEKGLTSIYDDFDFIPEPIELPEGFTNLYKEVLNSEEVEEGDGFLPFGLESIKLRVKDSQHYYKQLQDAISFDLKDSKSYINLHKQYITARLNLRESVRLVHKALEIKSRKPPLFLWSRYQRNNYLMRKLLENDRPSDNLFPQVKATSHR